MHSNKFMMGEETALTLCDSDRDGTAQHCENLRENTVISLVVKSIYCAPYRSDPYLYNRRKEQEKAFLNTEF
jgi:hypothetical protein